jgi:hypothetical protein
LAKEYWRALTKAAMRSCCGRSGSIVVELRHRRTPLYTSGHTFTVPTSAEKFRTYLLRQSGGAVC